MSKTNVLEGRARFDEPDAKGVVVFLQEQGGAQHRGYNQPSLAQMIVNTGTVHMNLTEIYNHGPIKVGDGWETLQTFVDKVSRLSKEVDVKPVLQCYGGIMEASMPWERKATDMEMVAAKAYLRDYDERHSLKKAKTSNYRELRYSNDPFGGTPSVPEPAEPQSWQVVYGGSNALSNIASIYSDTLTTGDTNADGYEQALASFEQEHGASFGVEGDAN